MGKGNHTSRGQQRDKPFRDAIRIVAKELEAGEKPDYPEGSLRWNALRLLTLGEVPAIREIADRLDGKVPQAVTGEDGEPIQVEVSAGERLQALAALIAKVKAQ